MEAYRVEATIEEDGTLEIKGLPFTAGEKVEVTIRTQSDEAVRPSQYPLRGTVIRFEDPFEPIASDEWNAYK